MSPLDYRLYYQRNLPHYQLAEATLFTTFRLAGSLPQDVIQRLELETLAKQRIIDQIADTNARKYAAILAQKRTFASWDAELDAACQKHGWLSESGVASLVCEGLHYRDGRVYTLEAFCVMPNHIHLVCTPLSLEGNPIPISKIMHSLKGYTARKANQVLGRQGFFLAA